MKTSQLILTPSAILIAGTLLLTSPAGAQTASTNKVAEPKKAEAAADPNEEPVNWVTFGFGGAAVKEIGRAHV